MRNLPKIIVAIVGMICFGSVVAVVTGFPVLAVLAVLFILSLFPQPAGVLKTVVSNPLIGKSRKSMGNATFSTWKGINVLKEKPQSVANPNTQPQLQARDAFKQIVAMFREQPAAIRAAFKKQAVKKSEFNAFMSANIPSAFDYSTPGVATLVPADLVTGKGTIAATAPTSIVVDRSANTIVVNFPTTADQPGQSTADTAIISAVDATQNLSTGGVTAALRSAGTASITLPTEWNTGDTVGVYLTFYNTVSGESSDSQYISGTIVA